MPRMAIPGRIATLATGKDKIDKDRIRQTVTSDAGVPDNDLTAPGAWGSRQDCVCAFLSVACKRIL